MGLKNCLLRGGSAQMLPQVIHSDSEGGGEDELDHFPTSQASQMLENDSSDLNSDDLLRDIEEISMPLLETLFPVFDIDPSGSGEVGSHNEDGIVHKIEAENNSVHQFKTEALIFAQDQNSGPVLLTASGASGEADVKVHTTAVNGEKRPSALIQVDAQIVEYKPVISEKISKTNLQKKTKSSNSTSAAKIGTARKEGARKRVLKRPAVKLQQRAITNNSRKKSVKNVNTKKPKKICPIVDAPNLNAAKARANRIKKKQETTKLQSENAMVKKMHEELKQRNEELYIELQNQKKMNAAFFGFQRIYPSVIGPIQTVLKSLKEENVSSAGGDGGQQWEIQYPPWFSRVSTSNVNNIEVVLRSMGFPLEENILSASKYVTLHFNPFDRIIKIDYNPQEPNVSAHVTPPV